MSGPGHSSNRPDDLSEAGAQVTHPNPVFQPGTTRSGRPYLAQTPVAPGAVLPTAGLSPSPTRSPEQRRADRQYHEAQLLAHVVQLQALQQEEAEEQQFIAEQAEIAAAEPEAAEQEVSRQSSDSRPSPLTPQLDSDTPKTQQQAQLELEMQALHRKYDSDIKQLFSQLGTMNQQQLVSFDPQAPQGYPFAPLPQPPPPPPRQAQTQPIPQPMDPSGDHSTPSFVTAGSNRTPLAAAPQTGGGLMETMVNRSSQFWLDRGRQTHSPPHESQQLVTLPSPVFQSAEGGPFAGTSSSLENLRTILAPEPPAYPPLGKPASGMPPGQTQQAVPFSLPYGGGTPPFAPHEAVTGRPHVGGSSTFALADGASGNPQFNRPFPPHVGTPNHVGPMHR